MRLRLLEEVNLMTICPIALLVGCEKCPAFKFCPLTTVLGDQKKEDEVDASPMTSAHDRDWSKAISQKEIPLTSDHPDFLSANRSTEDEYQRYAEEELKKNTKQMERALNKGSSEKKSADDQVEGFRLGIERKKKDKLEKDLATWKRWGK